MYVVKGRVKANYRIDKKNPRYPKIEYRGSSDRISDRDAYLAEVFNLHTTCRW